MSSFLNKIDITDFSVEKMDISKIQAIEDKLPRSGVFDLNIAEVGLVLTLEAQNLCQDKIIKIDRYIGYLEGQKNKAWSKAALVDAKTAGYKTAKDKEWYAQSDDDYVNVLNEVTLAKATKKWLENKASYFSGWHYAFKTFLRRDYSIENLSGVNFGAYNDIVWGDEASQTISDESKDFCGNEEIEWDE